MKKVISILFVLFILASCAPLDCDCPTIPPAPTATATIQPTTPPNETQEPPDPRRWWEHTSTDTWPTEIDGIKVAYLIVTENVLLRREYSIKENGTRVFIISTVKGLRPGSDTIPSRRVEAKAGKIIMIVKNPSQIPGEGAGVYTIPFSDYVRPFKGDGGNHAFWIMHENIIDGIYIGDHPGTPLFLPYAVGGVIVVEPYYP